MHRGRVLMYDFSIITPLSKLSSFFDIRIYHLFSIYFFNKFLFLHTFTLRRVFNVGILMRPMGT